MESVFEVEINQSGNSSDWADESQKSVYSLVTTWMWMLVGGCFVFLGIIGNILVTMVFCQPSMIKKRSAIYFIGLAIADIINVCAFVPHYLTYTFQSNVISISSTTCKVTQFATYTFGDISIWFLVILAIDRTLAVRLSEIPREIDRKRTPIIRLLFVTFLASLVNGHLIYGFEKDSGNESAFGCAFHGPDVYMYFTDNIWNWLDIAKYSVIPVAILVVCNAVIIKAIKGTRKSLSSVNGDRKRQKDKPTSSLTAILIATTIQLLVTTLPIVVALSVVNYLRPVMDKEMNLVISSLTLLAMGNNALNCVTYCLSGRRFRSELIFIVTRRPRNKFSNSGTFSQRADISMH